MAKGTPKTSLTDAQKEAKFKDLAGKRMNRILKGIESLSKLSAVSRYRYNTAQVDKMEKAFQDSLNHCFAGFRGAKASKTGFQF